MAISGIQVINVGLQNESTGSDSLYTAFNKTKTNFNTLFNNASPYNTFTANTGIGITANANLGTVNILNTGVTSIIAGTGIAIDSSNGAVTITNTGGNGNGAGVTSVGVVSSTLTVSGTPIVSSGNITVNLPTYANLAGTYTYPTVTVDTYGRVTQIANANSVGTVTSIGVTPGAGIQVTGSPITTSGNINIINTGVTRLNQGSGISLSSSNGNVTISTTPVIAVTSVGISSSTLTVSGSPITTTGTMTVDLPANTVISGRVSANTIALLGNEDLAASAAANLLLTASYFTTTAAETATLAAGTTGQIKTFMMAGDGGDMVITVTNAGWKSSGTGTITFNDIGDGCTLQYVNSKWFCIGQNGVAFA
jgi:hypothetical protein